MDNGTDAASALFDEAVTWLRDGYGQFEFWTERDLVWTVQTRLRKVIGQRGLPYEVFNDFPLLPGSRRGRSADLVIRNTVRNVLVAAEFKYEPSHRRAEFGAMLGKLPVVSWGADGVANDLVRIREFVDTGTARKAFALLIDEGGYFRHRPAQPGTAWQDWEPSQPGAPSPSVLWGQWPQA